MAGLDALLQRIARSLEEAGAQRPGDDLRARLGYGTGDEEDDEESVWEPETGRERETRPEPDMEPEPEAAHTPPRAWKSKTVRSRETPGSPAPPSTMRRAAGTQGAPAAGRSPGGTTGSRTPPPPHAHASPAHALPERIRARLRTPDALREAFVVKEILDRPLARRRAR